MNYHFEDTLTTCDCKRHIPHTFVVPETCGQVELDFRYGPQRVNDISNLLTLTLFDPNGFRGAGHRSGTTHHETLSAVAATPGYLPGPLPAGEWVVQLDTHMIMPGEPVHYELDVTLTEDQVEEVRPPAAARPALTPRGAGWYRGDLHTHTHHSDAENTVADLLQLARDYELDFVFLTDHNTITGLAEMDAANAPDLLTCGGIELTTFWGHALCLGTRAWVDWRIRPGDGGMARIAAETYAADGIFIIAHPQADGDPGCTGCSWRYGDMMPGNARLVEIWNGPWRGDSNNEAALALWYDWLNQGWRMIATAGTDVHSRPRVAVSPGFNVVYVETLTEAALLDALRAGHLYLSAGPQLTFQAQDTDGAMWISGDTVAAPVTLTVAWEHCPAEAQVRLIANGRLLEQRPAGVRGEASWPLAPNQADWVLVEIRDGDGEMLAVANPIFFRT